MMVRNPEAVPEASAQTASDSIAGPQTSHSKLTRRGKQKRKRVDQDEVEVEAIVAAESPEGVSTVREVANPGRRKRMPRKPRKLRRRVSWQLRRCRIMLCKAKLLTECGNLVKGEYSGLGASLLV